MQIGSVGTQTQFKGRNSGDDCGDRTVNLLSAAKEDLQQLAVHRVANEYNNKKSTKIENFIIGALPAADIIQTAARSGDKLTSKMGAGAVHTVGWTLFYGLVNGIHNGFNKISDKIKHSDKMQNFEDKHPKAAKVCSAIGGTGLYVSAIIAAAVGAFTLPKIVANKVGELFSQKAPQDVVKNTKNLSDSIAGHINGSKVAKFTDGTAKKLVKVLDKPIAKIGIGLGVGALLAKIIADPFRLSKKIKNEYKDLKNQRDEARNELLEKVRLQSAKVNVEDMDIENE